MRNTQWDGLPEELKKLKRWVYWKAIQRDGKMTKIPFSAHSGHPASTTNPDTWSTFEQAVLSSVNGNGIGFVFVKEDGYVGLDVDGECDDDLIQWFNTYAEKSQSGRGVHIIMKGTLPKRFNDDVAGVGRRSGKWELYSQARYFVMTSNIIHPEPIRDCQAQIDQFLLEVFPAPTKEVNIANLMTPVADPTILDRIRNSAQSDKFERLWSGMWQSDFASQSEADASLLSILRFWTGGSQAEAFRLFRQSGLMRPKAERSDYLTRTWSKLTGDVYEAVEPVPAQFIQKKNSITPPWRNVTIGHVEAAIAGTLLDPMIKALCSPTDPPLPLEVGLAKALALCGCALSGKSEKQTLNMMISKGGDLSKVRIMTGGGQTPNFWTLLVGESASGKDIGGIVDKAAMQFKWHIGSAGSEEGIADAYIAKPTGLLAISEMMNWLDTRHWQSKAAGFLTHAFNKGWFSHAMSRRGESQARESNYCFPNICASVQPGILQDYASKAHVDSGFLGRFLVMQMPEFVPYPRRGSLDAEVKKVVEILKILTAKEGEIEAPDRYNAAMNDMFSTRKAQPGATWRRLTSEYYPRLALLLSCPADDTSTTVTFTDDGWKRAEVLVNYLFAQAESVFSTLHFDPVQSKFENLCRRILAVIETSSEKKLRKCEISWKTGRGTKSKDRDEALKELLDRGLLVQEQNVGEGRTGVTYRAA